MGAEEEEQKSVPPPAAAQDPPEVDLIEEPEYQFSDSCHSDDVGLDHNKIQGNFDLGGGILDEFECNFNQSDEEDKEEPVTGAKPDPGPDLNFDTAPKPLQRVEPQHDVMPPMGGQDLMPPMGGAPAPVPKVAEPPKAQDDELDLGNFDFGGLEDMNDVGDINLDGFDLSTLDNGATEPQP